MGPVLRTLVTLTIVSGAYFLAFAVSFGLIMPAQRVFWPEFANHASILFLPHGVRVLVAWLYGWRAIFFLMPSALVTHAYLFGLDGLSANYLFGALSGVVCATASFAVLAQLGMDFRAGQGRFASWREVLLAGSFASVINVIGTSFFFGSDFSSASAYFIGDLVGLMVAMVLMMLAFRLFRKTR